MKQFLVLLMVVAGFSAYAQKIKFKLEGQKDTTVYLVKYWGKSPMYADTAELKNGIVTFDAAHQKPGLMGLYIPDVQIFDFIYNEEKETYIEAKGPNFIVNAVAKKSEENKIFFEYVQYLGQKKPEAGRIGDQMKGLQEGSEKYNELKEQRDAINKEVEDYQKRLIRENEEMLVAKIIKMMRDIEIPDAPVDEAGNIIDSSFQFNYFRDHFWDNVDLSDDRLMRTPIFDNKLKRYLGKTMISQHWDTILVYAFDFIDRLDVSSDMFQYVVSTLASEYGKSKIMGMNKVYVYMGKRYFCPDGKPIKVGNRTYMPVYAKDGGNVTHWVKKSSFESLCENISTHYNLVMGTVPPNVKLRDTSDAKYYDFMSLDNEFTILYFWDPDCGHCKKITPKLQTLYEKKWRERNIDVFAVGKCDSEELFGKWKKFISGNNLEFINVGLTPSMREAAMDQSNNQMRLRNLLQETTLESLNYQQTYDIFATPKVWVLNKDKEIIAYSLTVSQLEDLMDRLQGKQDSEKLFPPEENQEDEKMH